MKLVSTIEVRIQLVLWILLLPQYALAEQSGSETSVFSVLLYLVLAAGTLFVLIVGQYRLSSKRIQQRVQHIRESLFLPLSEGIHDETKDEFSELLSDLYHFRNTIEVQQSDVFQEKSVTESEVNPPQPGSQPMVNGERSDVIANSAFLSFLCKEFQDPLSTLVSSIDGMLKSELPPTISKSLQEVSFGSHRLKRTIDDVVELSEIRSGKVFLSAVEFDFNETIKRVILNYVRECGKRNLTLTHTIDGCIPTLLDGDEARYKQMLSYLLQHAIKLSEPGESVQLKIYSEVTDFDSVCIRVQVTTSQLNLDENRSSTLVIPNLYIGAESDQFHGGTSVGMMIVKSLVELFEGSIDVRSISGEGALVSVSTSFQIPESARDSVKMKDQVIRVLLVEDDSANRKAITSVLEDQGFDVILTDGGQGALEVVEGEEVDVILLDSEIEKANPFQFLDTVTDLDESYRKVPVVVLSSDGELPIEEITRSVANIISKPVDFDALISVLSKIRA